MAASSHITPEGGTGTAAAEGENDIATDVATFRDVLDAANQTLALCARGPERSVGYTLAGEQFCGFLGHFFEFLCCFLPRT